MTLQPELVAEAAATLKNNDFGGYIVPTQNLYPFQWNWDSAIHALGLQAAGDERRAWQEIETLLASVWDNGLLPHIIFHKPSETYFPNAKEWGTDRVPPTSSISQPPLVGYAMLRLFLNSPDQEYARARLRRLYPQLARHIRWWFNDRWDDYLQLTFTAHPWESGRDNSPIYDEPLAAVGAIEREYNRRDVALVDMSERPHKFEYDRYMYLVDFFKKVNFDANAIRRECPYKVCDAGLNAVLARSAEATLRIAEILGETPPADIAAKLDQLKSGYANLWCEELQTYCGYDLIAAKLLRVPAAEGFFAMFGVVASAATAAKMNAEIVRWLGLTKYGVAGVAPDSPFHEPRRYCRGPVWVIINWLIATGLTEYGYQETAEKLKRNAIELVGASGFSEYYDPRDGKPCGGERFSWTAALALHWLNEPAKNHIGAK